MLNAIFCLILSIMLWHTVAYIRKRIKSPIFCLLISATFFLTFYLSHCLIRLSPSLRVNHSNIFWDSSGADRYHSTNRLFLPGNSDNALLSFPPIFPSVCLCLWLCIPCRQSSFSFFCLPAILCMYISVSSFLSPFSGCPYGDWGVLPLAVGDSADMSLLCSL